MRVRVGPETSGRVSFAPSVVVVVEESFLPAPQPPSFDLAADGRLLLLERLPAQPPSPIEAIFNWDHTARGAHRRESRTAAVHSSCPTPEAR